MAESCSTRTLASSCTRPWHFALLTATNIDGATYVAIDRKTGEPAATQPEGETWYKDSRMSDSYFVVQDFYSAWSHLFDRGHLTRRDDPTWGEFATRANKDTFHFTNCTPQHWKFNESIKFWQGIERYVLEQGLFVSGRISRWRSCKGQCSTMPMTCGRKILRCRPPSGKSLSGMVHKASRRSP